MDGIEPLVARAPSGPASCDGLADPARLRALADAGLTAEADPEMDALARRVCRRLGVPVALVSLVHPDRQVFPGMAGVPGSGAGQRSTPLSHSFCRYVAASAQPLVVTDARRHPLVHDNPAVTDMGVVAYAGMPLTDAAGRVLGSLCAIDHRPRRWTALELDTLRDLADLASTELRLRLARFDARTERMRRDELDVALRRSFDHSQTLLAASQAFTDTVTAGDVRDRLGELVTTGLRPSYVGMSLLGADGRLRRVPDGRLTHLVESTGPWRTYGLDAPVPTAAAVRGRRVVAYRDRAQFDVDHPEPVRRLLREMDLHAVVAVPLPHVDGPRGALVLGWDAPHDVPPADLVVITTIAGYTAQALDRARRLSQRDGVAHQLQRAMLTTLPTVPGVEMAAHYQPADAREHVGGDWYDAVVTPELLRPGVPRLTVSVGDVAGHTVHAATVMGQVRSMLRQAGWEHSGEPPSVTLGAFERAAAALGFSASGSALLAHLHPTGAPGWEMTWTNAGHPPPVVLGPDGRLALLDGHDILFGYADLTPGPRRDHHVVLEPGSTLFLYTDGLVERRGSDVDAGIDALVRFLDPRRRLPPRDLVDEVVDALAADTADDVVAFALRV